MNERFDELEAVPIGNEFDGFEVFIVGGAVRDAVRGESPNDIDLMAVPKPGKVDETISRLRSQMKKQVNPETSFPVFMDHLNREVALPRTENSTGEGTQDFEMSIVPVGTPVDEAVSIDLERRDLTMNAMAFNVRTGELFDPFDGLDDIEKGIVRHVSDAFSEDPLRVVRMARFAGRFDATVATETRMLAREIAPAIESLPKERMMNEMRKAFKQSERPDRFFVELERADALQFAFPTLAQVDLRSMSRIIKQAHSNIGNDKIGLFGALGLAIGEEATREFIDNNTKVDDDGNVNTVLMNDEKTAMNDGATFVEEIRILQQNSLTELLDVATRLNGSRGLNRENGVGLASIMPVGRGRFNFIVDTDKINRLLDVALKAIETIDGQHVMDAENIQQDDIGTVIDGSEFSRLIDKHRLKMIENELD